MNPFEKMVIIRVFKKEPETVPYRDIPTFELINKYQQFIHELSFVSNKTEFISHIKRIKKEAKKAAMDIVINFEQSLDEIVHEEKDIINYLP